jgi:SAM-dependent methyltransferase
VAPGAIEKARAAAERAGLLHVRYSVADGNELTLEPGLYDVAFGVHSIHHIERLERVFEQVARSLRTGGLFFMNEFVGPTRFQWSDRQLEVVNGLLRAIPAPFRRSTVSGERKEQVPRPSVAEMIAADPSEAVRSAEILDPDGYRIVVFQPSDLHPDEEWVPMSEVDEKVKEKLAAWRAKEKAKVATAPKKAVPSAAKSAPKKPAPKKPAPKKPAPRKPAPKKPAPKKAARPAPKKAAPKKAAPRKPAPKKAKKK